MGPFYVWSLNFYSMSHNSKDAMKCPLQTPCLKLPRTYPSFLLDCKLAGALCLLLTFSATDRMLIHSRYRSICYGWEERRNALLK